MKNRNFYSLLRRLKTKDGRGYTVSLMATELNCNRSRLTDTLNNLPGHGYYTRRRVIERLAQMAGQVGAPQVNEFLEALGWDENGMVINRVAESETKLQSVTSST